jgi:CO/xanthine dehydrogenase FAD-binding subunit
VLLNPLTFHAPQTAREAAQLFGTLPGVRIQAGGTFLLNSLKLLKRNGAKTPEHVLSLGKVGELKGLFWEKDQLIIKSMTTITDIFEYPELKDNTAVLRKVCRDISTTPIRNMATVGGNLTCRYTWTEMPAVMIGLEAKLHFLGADGQTEIVVAQDFFKNEARTHKILLQVSIPHQPQSKVVYRRVKKTVHVDIPLLSFLIKTTPDKGCFSRTVVAVNNCVAFAQRDTALETFLNGRKMAAGLGSQALDHLTSAIYDTRSSDYKKAMFRVSMKSAIDEIVSSNGSDTQ